MAGSERGPIHHCEPASCVTAKSVRGRTWLVSKAQAPHWLGRNKSCSCLRPASLISICSHKAPITYA
jgi:hypothetical protein